MWERLLPPGASRRRIYADGKPHRLEELWRRWSWLAFRAVSGVLALGLAGMLCLALARGNGLQGLGFLLMSISAVLLALAAAAAFVALAVALVAALLRRVQGGRV